MTVQEAAREIGLSADAVYDLCNLGLLGHRRVGPNRGRIQILPSHVAAYLAACEVEGGATPAPARPARPKVKAPKEDRRPDGKPFRFAK